MAYQRARNVRAEIATGVPVIPKPAAQVVRFIPNVPFGVPKRLPKPEPVNLALENLGIRRRAYDAAYEYAWNKIMCGQSAAIKSLLVVDDVTKLRRIRDVVCENYSLRVSVFLSARRQQPLVDARQVAMFLAKNNTGLSLPRLGRWLGGRDHTTVLHGIRSVERKRLSDPDLNARLEMLQKRLVFEEAPDAVA